MNRIGIRELRQNASGYLRDVEGGERIEVTDRGRPIAWLVPIPQQGGLEALVLSGRLAEPTRSLGSLPDPLEPVADVPRPSEELAILRAGER